MAGAEDVDMGGLSSDSDSDSENEVDQEQLAATIAQCEEQLHSNPLAYDVHLTYIDAVRKLGNLQRIRHARERMSQFFPLTEELWLQWIQDEVPLVSSVADRDSVVEIFEKSTKDYISVDLWVAYAEFLDACTEQLESDESPSDAAERIRAVYERAIFAVGKHTLEGVNLWNSYREFEKKKLKKLVVQAAVGGADVGAELGEARKRVATLYKRQLVIPLIGMQTTKAELDTWAVENGVDVDDSIAQGYEKALERLAALLPFETELQQADAPRLAAYWNYISHLQGDNHTAPDSVALLYERALKENALDLSLWDSYIQFVGSTFKGLSDKVLETHERSVRNVSWTYTFWQQYMRALERHGQPNKIKAVLERSLGAGMSSAAEYKELWRTYLDFLLRRIGTEEGASDGDDPASVWRDTVTKAETYLVQYFPQDGDPDASLSQYQARVEAFRLDNMAGAREVYEALLAAGRKGQCAIWVAYINLEKARGSLENCRKLFQRAVPLVSDNPELLAEAWSDFERECGSLEHVDHAAQKLRARLLQVAERRQAAAAKEAAKAAKTTKPAKATKGGKKDKKKDAKVKSQTGKAGGAAVSASAPSGAAGSAGSKAGSKRKRTGEEEPDGAAEQVPTTAGTAAAPPSGSQPAARDGKHGQDSGAADAATKQPATKKPRADPAKPQLFDDSRTVHVKNFSATMTTERLQEFFSECGVVSGVRLPTKFDGRPKGFAYVEFESADAIIPALGKDRTDLDGQPVLVQPCKPKTTVLEQRNQYDPRILFVNNLSPIVSKEELEHIFLPFGQCEVRLALDRQTGASRGIAYAEFLDETAAQKAVAEVNGRMVRGKPVNVAVSDPPKNKGKDGGPASSTASGATARSSKPLVPRVVRREPKRHAKLDLGSTAASTAPGDASPANEKAAAPKSNADFRALLLGTKK